MHGSRGWLGWLACGALAALAFVAVAVNLTSSVDPVDVDPISALGGDQGTRFWREGALGIAEPLLARAINRFEHTNRKAFDHPYGESLKAVCFLPEEQLVVAEAQLPELLAAADVLALCDTHNVPACQASFARLLDEIDASGGRALLLLEAVPSEMQEALDACRAKDGSFEWTAVERLLRSHWPWPVSGYRRIFESVSIREFEVRGIGTNVAAMDRERWARVPDSQRVGVASSRAVFRHHLRSTNEKLATAANSWLREVPGGVVVAVCGTRHVLGFPSERASDAIAAAGFRMVSLLTHSPAHELVAAGRFGVLPNPAALLVGKDVLLLRRENTSAISVAPTASGLAPTDQVEDAELSPDRLADVSIEAIRRTQATILQRPNVRRHLTSLLEGDRLGQPARRHVVLALGGVFHDPSYVVPELVRLILVTTDAIESSRCARLLYQYRGRSEPWNKQISQLLTHRELEVRAAARFLLYVD